MLPIEPASLVMERKMLREIKRLAEALSHRRDMERGGLEPPTSDCEAGALRREQALKEIRCLLTCADVSRITGIQKWLNGVPESGRLIVSTSAIAVLNREDHRPYGSTKQPSCSSPLRRDAEAASRPQALCMEHAPNSPAEVTSSPARTDHSRGQEVVRRHGDRLQPQRHPRGSRALSDEKHLSLLCMESTHLCPSRDTAQKMSQENVEIVRRAYEAFNRADIDGALADLAPDFEYTPSGAIPGVTETYRGPEGFRRFVGWLLDEFDDVQFEINDVIGHEDDQLVFRHTIRGRGKRSGAATSWDVWQA